MNDVQETSPAPERPAPAGRTARWGLIGLAVLLLLVAVFYAEENSRGKSAWESCQTALAAQHETLDWADYIPPAVPDESNFFKAPKMQEWFVTAEKNQLPDLGTVISTAAMSNELTARLSLTTFAQLPKPPSKGGDPVRLADLILRPSGDGAAPSNTSAEPPILERVQFDNLPVSDALKRLAKEANLKVEIDPQVNTAWPAPDGRGIPRPPLSNQWKNVTAEAALLAVMCNNNLRWVENPKTGVPLIKSADFSGPPDGADAMGRDFVMGVLRTAVGSLGELAEGYAVVPKTIQSNGPVRLSVTPDSVPTKFELARLLPGPGSYLETIIEPVSNSLRVSLGPAPVLAADYLAWSAGFSADFDRIRDAVQRPAARLDTDYQQFSPIPLNFLAARSVAEVLSDRAKCYLLLGQSDQALRDLTLLRDFCHCLEGGSARKPITPLSAMADMALRGLYVETISFGLRWQVWNNPELAALEDQLGHSDMIPLIWGALESERAGYCHFLETAPRSQIKQMLATDGGETNFSPRKRLIFDLMPRGWLYQNMATLATLDQNWIDPIDRIQDVVYPHRVEAAWTQITAVYRNGSPDHFVAKLLTPNAIHVLEAAARTQAMINETLVVCALERFRLVAGAYPETLDALAPRWIPFLPTDPVNGAPLKYRPGPQGRFLLYSVGWDEKDNGGMPVNAAGNGDWEWGGL